MKKYDVIIIGGGPAGLSASIYTSRAMLSTLILEKETIGGQIVISSNIENYPGFPESIKTAELVEKMKKQAENFGVNIEFDEVEKIEKKNNGFIIKTDWEEYFAKGLILAVGSSPKKTGVPGEEKFLGKGVAFCATCDGPFFKDKDVIIVGAGNSGVQEGLFLLNYVNSLKFVEFMPQMNAEKILQERIKKKKNVDIYLNTELLEIIGDDRITGVKVRDRESKKEETLKAEGVFLYVGYSPNTGFLKDFVDLDKRGYIKTDDKYRTNINNVYAAGDVVSNLYSQVVISSGSGVTAAMSLIEDLEAKWSR